MILLPHRRRTMRPKKPETARSGDLFRGRLDQNINLKHELAQLAGQIDWGFIDGEIAPLYSEKGRPGNPDAVCNRAVAAQACQPA
jgi:IS5 family transposase